MIVFTELYCLKEIFRAKASSLGHNFPNHKQISFIFRFFVPQFLPCCAALLTLPHMKQMRRRLTKTFEEPNR